MPFTIFYSWQLKRESKFNKSFIEDCLRKALKKLKKEFQENSPDFFLDRDTKGIPGSPNIPTTLEKKILSCDIFVGDLTYVSFIKKGQKRNNRNWMEKLFGINKWYPEGGASNNVTEELGMAKGGFKGSERIIAIMNTAYGEPDQLYFDRKQYRYPITYRCNANTSDKDKHAEKDRLINDLKGAIEDILETQHERQKQYFAPFITWKMWEKFIDTTLPFERTEYIDNTLSDLKDNINVPKAVYRLCGLSGIGKTRMLFECFDNTDKHSEIILNKILYADVNEEGEQNILKAVKELLDREENKILFVDNCPKEFHNKVAQIVSKDNSRLSVVTVGSDPGERTNQLDTHQVTRLILIDNEDCKIVVNQILTNNFKELQPDELQLLVDFSSGIPLIATLMLNNPDRGKYLPGTLTQEEVVKRLLGALYEDEYSREVIKACSLFSKFGFFEELAYQAETIAGDDDFITVNPKGAKAEDLNERRINDFKQICQQLQERQLLERKGRTYAFRPSPLAVRMAEDWWRTCTAEKFKRVIQVLNKADLVEDFCKQFRYLNHVDNAKAIVQQLCGDFFSQAEVLNTSVGSRLFRSFVYVNSDACAGALVNAFLNVPKEELREMKEGRRNLVWALEKLCFKPQTFDDSVKVMAHFSIAENENLGNNATSQFLQLFHIHLPGTAANLDQRWAAIEYCLNKTEDFQFLGIDAISSALHVQHFSRMGGAEDIGDAIPLKDYNPTGVQVYQYWEKAISRLVKYAVEPSNLQESAINVLKARFFGLCVEGGGKLIIPVMRELLQKELLDRMEIRSQVQLILNSGRIYKEELVGALKEMFNELMPTNFLDKFRIFVQQPSHEEYIEGDEAETGEKLATKVRQLAIELLQQKEDWPEIVESFMVPHIAEGFNFGKFISQAENRADLQDFVNVLLNKIRAANPENRNISILLGILSHYPEKEFTKTIFNQLVNDSELKQIAFTVARSTELSYPDICILLDEMEKGNFPSVLFTEFTYGWGLRHLTSNEIIEFIQRLREFDDKGKSAAFFILATWTNNDAELFSEYKDQMRLMIIEDSKAIFNNLHGSMDLHYYTNILTNLLRQNNDEELAKSTINMLIEEINQHENFYSKDNSFFQILTILQDKFFSILWKHLAQVYLNIDKYAMAAFHLKYLLGSRHDYNNLSEGLLFGGSNEKFKIIFEWCKTQKGEHLHWIAELLPLFNEKRSTENEWHPYAKQFIDEFGKDSHVLSAISAKLGSYSWIGSVVSKLESDKALFEKMVDHPFSEVRDWAQLNLEDVNHRIKWESNRDEEGLI